MPDQADRRAPPAALLADAFGLGILEGDGERRGAGDVRRAGAQPALLTAAVQQRRDGHGATTTAPVPTGAPTLCPETLSARPTPGRHLRARRRTTGR
jgi:hypothetical protein